MCLKYDFEPVRVPLDTVFGFAVFLPCGVESSLFLKAYGDAWSAAQGGRGVIAEPLVCLPGLGFVIREASSLPGIRSRAFISFCFIFIIFIFFLARRDTSWSCREFSVWEGKQRSNESVGFCAVAALGFEVASDRMSGCLTRVTLLHGGKPSVFVVSARQLLGLSPIYGHSSSLIAFHHIVYRDREDCL